jgi:hypothetical protein
MTEQALLITSYLHVAGVVVRLNSAG